jgi:molybdopterin-guanine dinucleotide biosynthesis protein A
MGRDKALLPWSGGTLLDFAVARLAAVAAEVSVLCGEPGRYPGRSEPQVPDALPDAGALGGVYSGLCADERPLGLFLAVDLPFVPEALLRHLLESRAGADAVVPVTPRGPEPLCALYTRSCRDPIRRRLESGERRMTCFWPDVRVRHVGPEELARFGDPAQLFRNLNTAGDYETAAGARGVTGPSRDRSP